MYGSFLAGVKTEIGSNVENVAECTMTKLSVPNKVKH